MGNYLNPDNDCFSQCLASSTYVDKSDIIALLSPRIKIADQKYICISRSRRFGKTWAANMLAAYYSRGCDSKALFANLKISRDPIWEKHLNAYDVIRLNIAERYRQFKGNIDKMQQAVTSAITGEVLEQYPDVNLAGATALNDVFQKLYQFTNRPVIFIVDEWDHVFRTTGNAEDHEAYIEFLNLLFRDQEYVGLCYMTGIFPIKKYKGQSAMSYFKEYSMIDPKAFAPFVGFTGEEVRSLCERFGADYDRMKSNYDGYRMNGLDSVYCPLSVTSAIVDMSYDDYWGKTDTFLTLSNLIARDFDGLKDDVILLLAGEHVSVDTSTYQNDLISFIKKDDVLTALAHIGYLGFEKTGVETGNVFLPNWEVAKQYRKALESSGMPKMEQVIAQSTALLEATFRLDETAVAEYLDRIHAEETSILTYNSEQSLHRTIGIAFFAAREYYTIVRELPGGKGFADTVCLPSPAFPQKPALVVELKWKSAKAAISQIKNNHYADVLAHYSGNMLLIGINYSEKTKKHTCTIEQWKK